MAESLFDADQPSARRVWAVGPLMRAVADTLSARFNPVAVRGELSGFSRAASGHCYFSLKDDIGQVRCALFRRSAEQLSFAPRDGQLVEARGKLDVYGARGDLQLIVESLQPAGQGALFEQFLKLKAQLEAAEYLIPPPVASTAPLLIAARAGSVPAMKALIEAGAKPNVKATDGLTLALAAAGSGNLEAVKYALTLDPNINAIAQGGKSIIHMVVANRTATNNEEIITYLADKGAILNVKDDRGTTPADFVNRVGPEKIRVFYVQFIKDRGVAASLNH